MSSLVMDPSVRNVLSTDLLFNIFSKFSSEHKIKAAQVCQMWRDVVYHESMWRNIKSIVMYDIKKQNVGTMLPSLIKRNISYINFWITSEQISKANMIILSDLINKMTSLHFQSIGFDQNVRTEKAFVDFFLHDMRNLIEVKITGYGVCKAVDNCITRCRNIVSLELIGAVFSDVDELLHKIAAYLRKLRSLTLKFGIGDLTDFGIGYLTGCIASDTQNVHGVHPQLETLKLGWCRVTDQAMQYISFGFQ